MKKILYTFFVLGFCVTTTHAQTTTLISKHGHEILPQEGDYSLSMNAVPVLNFALNAINVMNDNGSGAQHPGFVNGAYNSITGKKYESATKAYRGAITFSNSVSNSTSFYEDPTSTSEDPPEISDTESSTSTTILIGVGQETRRGHNRLQGVYGADVLLGLESSKTKTSYGTAGADVLPEGFSRELVDKDGGQIALGARAFVGVEYFIAPKISIGSEFGWGAGLVYQGRGKTIDEENQNGTIVEETYTGSSNGLSLGTGEDDGGSFLFGGTGALNINFIF